MNGLAVEALAIARGELQLKCRGALDEIARLEGDIQLARDRIASFEAKIADYTRAIQKLGGEIAAQKEETVG
jgi:predicted  nucleic acid-binding Zn-ribbon protein